MTRRSRTGPVRAGRGGLAVFIPVVAALLAISAVAPLSAAAAMDRGAAAPAALTASLERWLDAHSAYPPAPAPPKIALVEPWEARVLDRHAMRRGRLRALYDDESETIWLVRPWTRSNPRDVSVLLHELVHHRQASAKHWYCDRAQEWDAYKLQETWLAGLGLGSDFYWPAIALESSCTPRDIHPD